MCYSGIGPYSRRGALAHALGHAQQPPEVAHVVPGHKLAHLARLVLQARADAAGVDRQTVHAVCGVPARELNGRVHFGELGLRVGGRARVSAGALPVYDKSCLMM